MKNLKVRKLYKVPFLLAALMFLADLIFGLPVFFKKIVLSVILIAMVAVVVMLIYQETRPQQRTE